MKNIKLITKSLFILLILTLPIFARAGLIGQLFGKYQACDHPPIAGTVSKDRYIVDKSENTIFDTETMLAWKLCPEGTEFSEGKCEGKARKRNWLDSINRYSFTGTDWRLPNIDEAKSFADLLCQNDIANQLLPKLPSTDHWTSSPAVTKRNGSRAWELVVDKPEMTDEEITDENEIILVRGKPFFNCKSSMMSENQCEIEKKKASNLYDPSSISITLTVFDIDTEKPLQNTSVNYLSEIKGAYGEAKSGTCVTNSNGRCNIYFKHSYWPEATITFTATGERGDSFKNTINRVIDFDLYENNISQKYAIGLETFESYICKDVKNIEPIVPILLRKISSIENASPIKKGFCTTEFKGKKYFSISARHDLVYNSEKLDDYKITIRVFDEIVRKLLSIEDLPIPDSHGLDVNIHSSRKSFIDNYSSNKEAHLRFLLPSSAIKRYRDKDITGQKLIDESIILFNDERYDIKLQ